MQHETIKAILPFSDTVRCRLQSSELTLGPHHDLKRKALRVLIVEEAVAEAKMVERELTDSGYEVAALRVSTPEEFTNAIATRDWDVVISDYALPGFGAIAALKLLQTSERDIPFIIVSGSISDDTAVSTMRAGAHDYVLKDNVARLAPAIERELKEAESRRLKREAEAEARKLSAQAERELQHSRALLAEAERLSHTGAWEWDLETDRWTFSDEWLAIHGCTPAPQTAADLLPIAHPEDRAAIALAFDKARKGIAPYEMEHRIVRQDNGEIRTVVARGRYVVGPSGNVVKVYGFAQDITERKRAEEALLESESRFRAFMDNSPAVAWMKDESGRYVYLSETCQKRFGGRLEDWIGKTDAELWPPEMARRFRENDMAVLASDRALQTTEEALNPDGSRSTMLNSKFPVRNSKGERFVAGIGVDVTARISAEEALRESEQRVRTKLNSIVSPEGDLGTLDLADIIDVPALQSLFEDFNAVTQMPVAVIDIEGKVLVGAGWQDICTQFHRVNPESCRHCIESDSQLSAGIPAGQFKLYQCMNHMWDVATPIVVGGRHVGNVFTGQFFFDDETPDVEVFRQQALQFGFPESEYLAALDRVPRLRRDTLDAGMKFLMKLADMISKLSFSNLNLARSLAERETLTAALRQSEQRFRTVAESVPQMLWASDAQSNFLYLSPKWLHYTGTSDEQNVQGAWVNAIHPDDRKANAEAWNTAVKTNGKYEVEYRLRRHDGEYRWHSARAVPVQDSSRNVIYWFGTTTDVHDQKRAQEVLIRSEKLASVGRMAATIAHEINNPLAAAMNAIFLACTETSLPATVHERLDLAERELERVAHITKQTLGFYRETGNPVLVSLPEVIDGVLDLYGPKLKNKPASVQRRYRARSAVQGIEGELRQAVSNLVTNGIDALGANGVLHVRTSGPVSYLNRRPMVRVTIADTGAGIRPENFKHIFEPFFTTKEAIGTGLGLWVTKELVKKHDGRIRVRSCVGKGTTFSIWLPVERRKHERDEFRTELSDNEGIAARS